MTLVLTVFGATGRQGGSAIATILAHAQLSDKYKIRAVTRNANKTAAIALKAQGCEIIEADLSNSLAVKNAVKGSSVVFGVTDFWTSMSDETEIAQGKNIADACKLHGVHHLIFSSLVHVSRASSNRLTSVKHFDSKGIIEEYIRKLEIPCSFYLPGGFMSDFWKLFLPVDGVYTMKMPLDLQATKIPLIDAVADTGKYVAAMILEGPTGSRVAASAAYYSPEQIAEVYAKSTEGVAITREITESEFAATLPEQVREEILGNMQLLSNEYGYYLGEPSEAVERGHQLLNKYDLGPVVSLEAFAAQKAKEASVL